MTMYSRKTPKTFKEMREIASRPPSVEETDDEDDLDYDGVSDFERFNGQGYERKKNSIYEFPPRTKFLSLGKA